MKSSPFARAIEMFVLIRNAMSSMNPQLALAGLAPYKSRGKGRAQPFTKSWFLRRNQPSYGRYMPHQGKREIARRVRQAARAA